MVLVMAIIISRLTTHEPNFYLSNETERTRALFKLKSECLLTPLAPRLLTIPIANHLSEPRYRAHSLIVNLIISIFASNNFAPGDQYLIASF